MNESQTGEAFNVKPKSVSAYKVLRHTHAHQQTSKQEKNENQQTNVCVRECCHTVE